MKKRFFLLFAFVGLSLNSFCQENYSVLDYWKYYSDAENTLYKMQTALSFEMLDQRANVVAQLNSKEDWMNRQEEVKQALQRVVGPFSEKSP